MEKFDTVRDRASRTEDTIVIMTADIKKLHSTKQNMTLSMTALKRLLIPSRYLRWYLVLGIAFMDPGVLRQQLISVNEN